jgi:hypothetical protein
VLRGRGSRYVVRRIKYLVDADLKSTDKRAIVAGDNPNGLVMTLIHSFEIQRGKTLFQASG